MIFQMQPFKAYGNGPKRNNKWKKIYWRKARENSVQKARDSDSWTKVTLCFPTPSLARQALHSWLLQLKTPGCLPWAPSQRAIFLGRAELQNFPQSPDEQGHLSKWLRGDGTLLLFTSYSWMAPRWILGIIWLLLWPNPIYSSPRPIMASQVAQQ